MKWFRNDEYYSRPIKGSWHTEGGGALINQAIHQVDLLLYLIGPVSHGERDVATWRAHKIESEDVVNALLPIRSGATGVIQAATAFWPGYTERIEIHGTKGTAIISGRPPDQLGCAETMSRRMRLDPRPLRRTWLPDRPIRWRSP